MAHTQNPVHTCWSRTRFQPWLTAGVGTGEELSMTATNHETNLAYQCGNPCSILGVHHDDHDSHKYTNCQASGTL